MKKERLLFYGTTDMGRQRTNNEDAFVAEQIDDNTILAIAIDGVGGYEGGEVAAEVAKTAIPAYLKEFDLGERLESLKQAVVDANNAIYERRQTDEVRANMSCVLTAALIDRNRKVVDMVHVGDTRMYQFRYGKMVKLSHDHSLIGYREEMGDLTEEQAMHHPQRNVISRDVGSERHEVGDRDFLEAAEFPLLPNSIFLLCSDGLTDLVASRQIISVLEKSVSIEEKANLLIDTANAAGGKDNITVVLVEYQAEEANSVVSVPDANTYYTNPACLCEEESSLPIAESNRRPTIKPAFIIAVAALLLCASGCLLFLLLSRDKDFERLSLTDSARRNILDSEPYDVPVGEFRYMYDTATAQPWSSFLSRDSSYVLRFERVFVDSLGAIYRALVYERMRWHNGEWVCDPFLVPLYVGYGSVYFPTNCSVEMAFRTGLSNDEPDGMALRMVGDFRWDSLLLAIEIPNAQAEGKEEGTVFVKYSWDELKTWWNNPMCR